MYWSTISYPVRGRTFILPSRFTNSDSPNTMSSGSDSREERKPFQWKSLSAKNAEKKSRVWGRSSFSSTSMPKVMNSRCRSRSEGQMDDQMYCALRLRGSPAA